MSKRVRSVSRRTTNRIRDHATDSDEVGRTIMSRQLEAFSLVVCRGCKSTSLVLDGTSLTQASARYLESRLHDIFQYKSVFRKNDTLGMMIAWATDLDDSIVVTFDGSFGKGLRPAHPPSYEFNNKHGFMKQ